MTQTDPPPSPDTQPSPSTPPPPVDYQPPPAPPTVAGMTATQDDRNLAMIAHLLGIVLGFVGPLIIWLIKKEQSPFVEDQSKEALNFQITVLIAHLIAGAGWFFCIGVILTPAVIIVSIVFCIIAAMSASKGELYRYPFALRLIN